MTQILSFANIAAGEHVFHRLLLIEGRATSHHFGAQAALTVLPDDHSGFDAVVWQVNHGHFKALVPLTPGRNRLTFLLHAGPATRPTTPNDPSAESQSLEVVFVQPRSPPLHLAIIAAADSPVWHNDGRQAPSGPPPPPAPDRSSKPAAKSMRGFMAKTMDKLRDLDLDRPRPTAHDAAIVDAPPGPRREALKSGGLAEVKRRFALQAYLWQAFHAEQMRRHNLGRRSFQLDDSASDSSPQIRRSIETMPRIHLLRSRRTLREFRDPENAQQKANARNGGAMFNFAHEALMDPATPRELHWSPVAVLVLDTQYDPSMRLIRAHAAVGSGGPGRTSHGVMGSHWLWAAPSSLDQVTAAFLDTERTDERCCVNDLDECPTAWQTLNIGSGAFFHEAGHALNNPHWPSGLMARGYVEFNRAFMTSEPACHRNGLRGGNVFAPIHAGNDAAHFHVHRAQALRARWHPCFYISSDPPLPFLGSNSPEDWKAWNDAEPQADATMEGCLIKCRSGIASIEIEVNGEYRDHIEWTGLAGPPPPRETMITPEYLWGRISPHTPLASRPPDARVKLNIVACNMRQVEVDDFFNNGVAQQVRVRGGGGQGEMQVVKGTFLGRESDNKWMHAFLHEQQQAMGQAPRIVKIKIHAGAAFDGLALVYNNGAVQTYGPMGGSPSDFDVGPDDEIERLEVRCGAWIDAIEVRSASSI
ncbi:uncharacterized protein PSFLO_00588 [Pseudozyma flocculosa]|uniref:Jacalin-type lectin domain-containing protein n=1 Tax=Pseudozyma flocculosa TaxID=84751 RepID=A0A5C3EUG3_9BASI|nr:uncharacterized protein PSFLO_00588 [Pseudozyma flocculosa]